MWHGYVTIAQVVHDFHEEKVIKSALDTADILTVRYNKRVFLPEEAEFTESADYPEE